MPARICSRKPPRLAVASAIVRYTGRRTDDAERMRSVANERSGSGWAHCARDERRGGQRGVGGAAACAPDTRWWASPAASATTPPPSSAAADAAAVCAQLGIPPRGCRMRGRRSRACVVEPFVASYAAGLTPSPCVGCNARCKVPTLLRRGRRTRAATALPPGHYARIARLSDTGRFVSEVTALDARKDQSYMLSLLSPGAAGAPRAAAGRHDEGRGAHASPPTWGSRWPRSRGKPGQLLHRRRLSAVSPRARRARTSRAPSWIGAGAVLGRHEGLANYTVGQRKGIGVAGPEPYYVVEKRPATGELVVGFAQDALIDAVVVGAMNWQAFASLGEPYGAMVKLRYRSRPCACIIEPEPEPARSRQRCASPQPTTAPGQYAVLSVRRHRARRRHDRGGSIEYEEAVHHRRHGRRQVDGPQGPCGSRACRTSTSTRWVTTCSLGTR